MNLEGLRKILVGVVVLTTGILVTVYRNDIPPNLLQLLQVIFGGYIVGNVGEHVVGAVTAKANANVQVAQITADTAEPWDDEFNAIAAKLTDLNSAIQALANAPAAVDLGPVSASVAEIKAALIKATEQTGEQFDYASAVGAMIKSLEEIQASQKLISKALSTIIARS